MWGVQGFHEDLGGKAKIENIGNSGIRGNKKTNENKDLEKRNLRRKKKIGKTMSIFLFKSVENNGCRKNGHNWDCDVWKKGKTDKGGHYGMLGCRKTLKLFDTFQNLSTDTCMIYVHSCFFCSFSPIC